MKISKSISIVFVLLLLFTLFSCDEDDASTNANLSSLVLNNGNINPTFSPSVIVYTAANCSEDFETVTATAEDNTYLSIQIRIGGGSWNPVNSGAAYSISSVGSSTTIEIIVTAEDGITTKTYTIDASSDAP